MMPYMAITTCGCVVHVAQLSDTFIDKDIICMHMYKRINNCWRCTTLNSTLMQTFNSDKIILYSKHIYLSESSLTIILSIVVGLHVQPVHTIIYALTV